MRHQVLCQVQSSCLTALHSPQSLLTLIDSLKFTFQALPRSQIVRSESFCQFLWNKSPFTLNTKCMILWKMWNVHCTLFQQRVASRHCFSLHGRRIYLSAKCCLTFTSLYIECEVISTAPIFSLRPAVKRCNRASHANLWKEATKATANPFWNYGGEQIKKLQLISWALIHCPSWGNP